MTRPTCFAFLVLFLKVIKVNSVENECPEINITIANLDFLVPFIVPSLESKPKGDSGRICIVGGSIEYAGAPYLSAISALKVGADLAFVITTEEAAPIVRSYSPDVAVYAYLNFKYGTHIKVLLQKADLVVIGPGLKKDNDTLNLVSAIIDTCKTLQKPLVIDANGLDAISRNPTLIKDYPSPGIILTPNKIESNDLMSSIPNKNSSDWYSYWGKFVSVLEKGEWDTFHSSNSSFGWSSSQGGSRRRTGGQGDILAGFLGTMYNWALKKFDCKEDNHVLLSQSISAFATAKLTRLCNYKGFLIHGRSMVTSDMILQIQNAFEEVFAPQYT